MRTLFCAIALALAIGCTTAKVRPYVGQQQAWPTAIGSIVNTSYELPVFTSLPPSPYAVLAELRIDSPFYAQPEEHHLPCLVKKASKIGADAIVLVDGQVYFSTSYGPREAAAGAGTGGGAPTLTTVNRFNPDFFKPGVTAIAIKWVGTPPAGLFRNAVTGAAIESVTPAMTTPAAETTPVASTNEPPKVAPATATPTESKPETTAPTTEPPKTETTPAPAPAAPEPPKAETAPAPTTEQPKPAPTPTPETPAAPATPPETPKTETVSPPSTEQPTPAPAAPKTETMPAPTTEQPQSAPTPATP